MEAFRYYLALYLVVFLTPMLPAWLLVHSFIRVWRRLGLGWTYGLVGR